MSVLAVGQRWAGVPLGLHFKGAACLTRAHLQPVKSCSHHSGRGETSLTTLSSHRTSLCQRSTMARTQEFNLEYHIPYNFHHKVDHQSHGGTVQGHLHWESQKPRHLHRWSHGARTYSLSFRFHGQTTTNQKVIF